MAVNRFMTPAEMPEVSFFQIPQEQMRDALLSAQHQYDDAKDKLTLIGDTSFNYLTNVKNDTDLAKQVYSNLDQGVNNVLSKQGDGDLRKIRGDIQSLGREVGRWYKPDGDIGKLQSNYLLYNEWFKKQSEKKDLAPQYLPILAQKMLRKFDESGGSKKGSINLEELEAMPDVPKFFRENKDMVKATLNEYAKSKTNGVYFTDEGEAWKTLSPDEIKRVFGKLLMNDPTYGKFMQQAGRYEYYPEESLPLLVPVEKEYKNEKGETVKYNDYDVNYKNPFSSALTAVMEGLSENDYKQTHHLRPDGTKLDWLNYEDNKKPTLPMLPSSYDETLTGSQQLIQNLHKNFDGTPEQVNALVGAKKSQVEIAKALIYDENGKMKEEYEKLFGNMTDLKGTKIPADIVASAYVLASYDPENNLGHGSHIDREMFSKILSSPEFGGYKVDTNFKEDGLKHIWKGFTGLFTDAATDVPKLRTLTQDVNYLATVIAPWTLLDADTNPLQTAFRNNNRTPEPVNSLQSVAWIVPKEKGYELYDHLRTQEDILSTGNMYRGLITNSSSGLKDEVMKSGQLNEIASQYKIVNAQPIVVTENDKRLDPTSKEYDPSYKPKQPQRNGVILTVLKNPDKPSEGTEQLTIMLTPNTQGVANVNAGAYSIGLGNTFDYWGQAPVVNQTGKQAAQNIMGATVESAGVQDKANKK